MSERVMRVDDCPRERYTWKPRRSASLAVRQRRRTFWCEWGAVSDWTLTASGDDSNTTSSYCTASKRFEPSAVSHVATTQTKLS